MWTKKLLTRAFAPLGAIIYLSSLKLGPKWIQISLQACYFSLLCITLLQTCAKIRALCMY